MTSADAALAVEGLTARAGSFLLRPVDLRVGAGQVLVVLGPSGAGKTTLLDTIAGFRSPSAGRVHLGGRDVTGLAPERRRIGVVFQHDALFPHLSVRENVRFGLRAHGDKRHEPVASLLARFGIAEHANRHPRSLSGGERQRVALARALAADPDLLLLDEPLSALDQPSREELRGVLQDLLSGLGIPAVHVTHDRDEALSLADDVAVIIGGRLRQLQSARDIASRPADGDVARLLGWAELGEGAIDRGQIALGDLRLPADACPGGAPPDGRSGKVSVFYRPEMVALAPAEGPGGSIRRVTRTIDRILPTVPLARVHVAGEPPLSALVLHHELARLRVVAGDPIEVELPPDSVRVFPRVGAIAGRDDALASERRIPATHG